MIYIDSRLKVDFQIHMTDDPYNHRDYEKDSLLALQKWGDLLSQGGRDSFYTLKKLLFGGDLSTRPIRKLTELSGEFSRCKACPTPAKPVPELANSPAAKRVPTPAKPVPELANSPAAKRVPTPPFLTPG